MNQRNNTPAHTKMQQKMGQLLGSENGTDFRPDPRTRTVHICYFVSPPSCRSCICMWALAYACASACAYTHAHVPTRRQLRQRGRICARNTGCKPATQTNATCLLNSNFDTAAPRQRARSAQQKLVRPNLIFGLTEIDFFEKTWPDFWGQKSAQNLGRKMNLV